MLEQIFNLNFHQWSTLLVFFISSSIFGAFSMYLFLKNILKNMINDSIKTHQLQADDIIDQCQNRINNIQDMTAKKFELIVKDIGNLSEILSHLKQHLLKISDLENEIIKYKKIVKRLEKRNHHD